MIAKAFSLVGAAVVLSAWSGCSAPPGQGDPGGSAAGVQADELADVDAAQSPSSASGSLPVSTCIGPYAACAASTCIPTGNMITINSLKGPAEFPEAVCECPILVGAAVADLTGGTMQGSCSAAPGHVWSLPPPASADIPQACNGWQPAPIVPETCPASLGLGEQSVNCFSMDCTIEPGTGRALCHCPIGESLTGTPVSADTTFFIAAGEGDPTYCYRYPVSAPLSL